MSYCCDDVTLHRFSGQWTIA